MAAVRIIALSVAAAVVYGIVHDQVTARLCVEYFTVFHPRLIRSESPTVLGLFWGVVATWWVGLGLGVLFASAAQMGGRPKIGARQLLRPIVVVFAITGAAALAAGLCGYAVADAQQLRPEEFFGFVRGRIPESRNALFFADLAAHQASYFVGAIGGLVMSVWCWRKRGRMAKQFAVEEPPNSTKLA